MRLFFAIPFADATLDALALVVEELRARAVVAPIAWESRQKLHITLKFLGEMAEDAVPSLAHAARAVASRHRRFDLSLVNVSAFPAEDLPRILWIGLDEGAERARTLADDLDVTLASELGLDRESRPFVPHVTVGRSKGRGGERAGRALLASPTPFSPIAAHVGSFVLMVSRAGAYETLHAFELAS